MNARRMPDVLIRGTDRMGSTVWYTGRPGAAWVHASRNHALGFTPAGATATVARLNAGTAKHGVTFVPVYQL